MPFYPIRAPTTRQPRGVPRIDWSHPIVQKYRLQAAIVFQPFGAVRISRKGAEASVGAFVGNVSLKVQWRHGTGWKVNTLDEADAIYNKDESVGFTLPPKFALVSIGVLNSWNYPTLNTVRLFPGTTSLTFHSTAVYWTLSNNGGSWKFDSANSANPAALGYQVLAVGRDTTSTANDPVAFRNGVALSVVEGAVPTTTGQESTLLVMGSSVGNRCPDWIEGIKLVFAELPTAELTAELYKNPWQIFESDDFTYVAPDTATGIPLLYDAMVTGITTTSAYPRVSLAF